MLFALPLMHAHAHAQHSARSLYYKSSHPSEMSKISTSMIHRLRVPYLYLDWIEDKIVRVLRMFFLMASKWPMKAPYQRRGKRTPQMWYLSKEEELQDWSKWKRWDALFVDLRLVTARMLDRIPFGFNRRRALYEKFTFPLFLFSSLLLLIAVSNFSYWLILVDTGLDCTYIFVFAWRIDMRCILLSFEPFQRSIDY